MMYAVTQYQVPFFSSVRLFNLPSPLTKYLADRKILWVFSTLVLGFASISEFWESSKLSFLSRSILSALVDYGRHC